LKVLAVFPDTTSFYRAVVSKIKKMSGVVQEVVVKFEVSGHKTRPLSSSSSHVVTAGHQGTTRWLNTRLEEDQTLLR
jgi:hypothetical protein